MTQKFQLEDKEIDMDVNLGQNISAVQRVCIIHSKSSNEEISSNLTKPCNISSWILQ